MTAAWTALLGVDIAVGPTAKTIVNCIPIANRGFKIVEFCFGFDGTNPSVECAIVQMCLSTQATTGTSGTASNVNQIRGPSGYVDVFSAPMNYSAEPTVLTPVKEWPVPASGTLIVQSPLGKEIISENPTDAYEAIAFRMPSPQPSTYAATSRWRRPAKWRTHPCSSTGLHGQKVIRCCLTSIIPYEPYTQAGAHIYYAFQYNIIGAVGSGGYCGLQTRGSQYLPVPYAPAINFSQWNVFSGNGGYIDPYLSASFAGEGEGWQVHTAYPWVPGKRYRIQVRIGEDNNKIMASVNGQSIGAIPVPAGGTGFDNGHRLWGEKYGDPAGLPARCLIKNLYAGYSFGDQARLSRRCPHRRS